jgi:hypothetical protein
VAAAGVLAAGCSASGGAATPRTAQSDAVSLPARVVTAPSPHHTPPITFSATRSLRLTSPARLGFPLALRSDADPARRPGGGISWLPPGSTVPPRDITSEVKLGAGVNAGLADRGTVFGFVYPALSHDHGRSWTINGPMFFAPITDGAGATDRMVASHSHALIAWGHGGNLVKVSSDLGAHWRQTDFPSGVESARAIGTTLIVRALGDQLPSGSDTGLFATWNYRSTDGGNHWHRTTAGAPARY